MTNTLKIGGLLLVILASLIFLSYHHLNNSDKKSIQYTYDTENKEKTNRDNAISSDSIKNNTPVVIINKNTLEEELALYLEKNPLPYSLEGTSVAGGIAYNEEGILKKSLPLRELFDYLLTLENEWDEQATRIWLLGYAQTAAQFTPSPENAAQQVVEAFDTYLAYLKASDAIIPDNGYAHEDFLAKFKKVSAEMYTLRRDHFGAEVADNYFNEEEQYDQSQYDRAVILSDTSITQSERDQKLAQWANNIKDPTHRAIELEKKKTRDFNQRMAALRERGASDEEIHAVRAEAYGQQAAERLAALDNEQRLWQQRIDSYKEYYESLRELPISPAEMAEDMQDYIKARFTEREQRRLPQLSFIKDHPPTT